MLIYNVTVNIDHDVHDEWLEWMKTKHIPDVMKSKMFTEYRLCRLLNTDEEEGYTYAVQYTCNSMEQFDEYTNLHAPALKAAYQKKFEGKFVAFRSLLGVV
jgi:hypothetical protein